MEEDASAEIYQDEEVPEEATEDEGPDGNASVENSAEEISEDEALPDSEEPAQSVEDTVSASEIETAVAKNPSFSEDDEWLYSKLGGFAKKPANQQED